MTSRHRVQAQASMPLDVNGDGVSEFVNSTSGSPQFGGVFALVSPLTLVHPENAMLPMAVGETVGPKTPWVPGTVSSSVGYFGIRFWTAAGVHYGWLETYNPIVGGRPSFAGGGWTKRSYYNPEPDQPIAIGDESLVLRAQMNPANGKLKIHWNTDAAGFVSGLRVQRRSLQAGAAWTTVQTIGTGFETEVALSGDAAVFRVVQ